MRTLRTASILLLTAMLPQPLFAGDQLAKCKAFFTEFEQCAERQEGQQKDDAKVFVRTLRATLGMADDLNRGDAMMTSILCSVTMDEVKKDPAVQKYNCSW